MAKFSTGSRRSVSRPRFKRWDEKVSKNKASKLTRDLTRMGQTTKITLIHDHFGGETATYKQSASGWNAILSSLKTYVETGRPLQLAKAS
jgi:hypothetical protein